jgi:hypothetical protein
LELKSELSTAQIVDAGIDYLRITVKPGVGLRPFINTWQDLIDRSAADGHQVKPFRINGFSGVTCGGFKRLGREDCMMFEAEGAVANEAFEKCRQWEFGGNIPRIDAQVTEVRTQEAPPEPTELLNFIAGREEQRKTGRTWNLDLKRTREGADTLYVGSRNSGNYLCYYDAGAVHRGRYQPGAKRWESRFSNDAARNVYQQFQSAASVTCCATALVMGKLLSLDLPQPWFTSEPPIKPATGSKKTDDERSLAWLGSHVSATVIRLINKGYHEEVAELLGIKSAELRDDLRKPDNVPALARRLTKQGIK